MAEQKNSPVRSSAETHEQAEPDTFSAIQEAESSSSDDESFAEVPDVIFQFVRENGRTYHSHHSGEDGAYCYPNDENERDRLESQGDIFNFVFEKKLHFAPLDGTKPLEVIDIGTGTGDWACEMGDEYELFNIQGTDLSPIQPQAVPPNVQFFVDDSSIDDWSFRANRFDYIHTRAMLGSFSSFANVIKRAFYYTKPGGYTESQEFAFAPSCDDDSMTPNWPFLEWSNLNIQASNQHGHPLNIAHLLKGWYEDAGFVDVQELKFKMPLNPWPQDEGLKELGRMSEKNWLDGLGGFTMANFHRMLGWDKNRIEVYLVNVRKAIQDQNVHVYHNIHVVWGRKPFPNEVIPEPHGVRQSTEVGETT